jgi:hypothetical protein
MLIEAIVRMKHSPVSIGRSERHPLKILWYVSIIVIIQLINQYGRRTSVKDHSPNGFGRVNIIKIYKEIMKLSD